MLAPTRLITKLLIVQSISISIVVIAIGVGFHVLAADYFATLMQKYGIFPTDAHEMFLHAIDRYLILSSIAGFLVASAFSMWFYFRLISPIHQLTRSAQLISAGDYSLRVSTDACGEIAALAKTFNAMADGLERGERLRKNFIADIAHELRTPLTNIQGYMEGLRDGVVVPDRDVFVSMHEETIRLVHIVEDLLQLARSENSRPLLKLEAFDLNDLIFETQKRFKPRMDEKSLSLSMRSTQQVIQADKSRISQVLINLFENAYRYTPHCGDIEANMTITPNWVRVSLVNDTEWQDLDPEVSLFERFQRGEASRSALYGGAGLGLSIVKELVQAHGGKVGHSFGDGTADFWFELPIHSIFTETLRSR